MLLNNHRILELVKLRELIWDSDNPGDDCTNRGDALTVANQLSGRWRVVPHVRFVVVEAIDVCDCLSHCGGGPISAGHGYVSTYFVNGTKALINLLTCLGRASQAAMELKFPKPTCSVLGSMGLKGWTWFLLSWRGGLMYYIMFLGYRELGV